MIYRFNPNVSIPNSPFYYPIQEGLQTSSGPLIVGTGLTIDYTTGTISATGGGGGTGTVSVTSPIIDSGTPTSSNIGIETATASQLGAVQIGNNIDVQGGVISVGYGSTFSPGIVQLNDTTTSTSILQALTANQGRLLQQQINALIVASNLTLAGTFDASTSKMVTVSNAGAFAGFAVGSNLPLPSTEISDFFVIVSQAGIYTPPGNVTPVEALKGDWFLCEGSVWKYVNIGNQLPVATETSAGVIELATSTEVSQGVDATRAVTSNNLCAYYLRKSTLAGQGALITVGSDGQPSSIPVGANGFILSACSTTSTGLVWTALPPASIPCSTITGKGTLVTGTGASQPVALPLGFNGQVLTVNAACPTGLAWATCVNNAIPCACVTGKGAIITGLGPSAPTALPAGDDNQVLVACSACTTGLTWVAVTNDTIPCACITGKGSLIAGSAPGAPASFGLGTDGTVLTANSACPLGLSWSTAVSNTVPCACYTGKGVLLGGTGTSTMSALACGTNGQLLFADSTTATGLAWNGPTYIPCSCVTGKGSLITGSGINTPVALPVGGDGCVLVSCSTCPLGLTWAGVSTNASIPCSIITGAGVLVTGCATGVPYALPPGPCGSFLSVNPACPGGLTWVTTDFYVSKCCYTGKGVLLAGCAAGIVASVPPSTSNGAALVADSTCPTGMKWATIAGYGATAVGAIQWFAMSTAPTGWLVADGSAVSRTGYIDLYNVIGTAYGAGDGSTTFNLPDLRGQWIRGWDSAGGIARNCDPGRAFGSTQAGQVGGHNHLICLATTTNNGYPEWCCPGTGTAGCYYRSSGQVGACALQSGFTESNSTCSDNIVDNIALLPAIKWQITLAPASPSSGIPTTALTGKGTLITASDVGVPSSLTLGSTNFTTLQVCSVCPSGLTWASPVPPGGSNGQVLTACNTNARGVVWSTAANPLRLDPNIMQCNTCIYAVPSLASCCLPLNACTILNDAITFVCLVPGSTYLVNYNGTLSAYAAGVCSCFALTFLDTSVVPNPPATVFTRQIVSNINNTAYGTIPLSLSGTFTVPSTANPACSCFYLAVTNCSTSTGSFEFLFQSNIQRLNNFF